MDLTALARATVFISSQSKVGLAQAEVDAAFREDRMKSAHNLDHLQARFSLLLGASFAHPRPHDSARNETVLDQRQFAKLPAPKVETPT